MALPLNSLNMLGFIAGFFVLLFLDGKGKPPCSGSASHVAWTHLDSVLPRGLIVLLGANIREKVYFSSCSCPCDCRCWGSHYYGFKHCKFSCVETTAIHLLMTMTEMGEWFSNCPFSYLASCFNNSFPMMQCFTENWHISRPIKTYPLE